MKSRLNVESPMGAVHTDSRGKLADPVVTKVDLPRTLNATRKCTEKVVIVFKSASDSSDLPI